MTHLNRALAILIICLTLPLLCPAQKAPVNPTPSASTEKPPDLSQAPYFYETVRGSIRFENDGTGTQEIKTRIKVQSSLGVEKIGQLVFAYNNATERLDVLSVHVIKPDGQIVVTGPDAVQVLSAPVAIEAPMYSDARQKHVTVAGLSAGDVLESDVLTTTTKALAPGQFWQSWAIVNSAPSLDEQLELNVPLDRAIKIKNPPDVTPTAHTEGTRRIYLWKTSTPRAEEAKLPFTDPANFLNPEAMLRGAPPLPHRSIAFTTFQNWDQVGAWYSSLERDRRIPSPEIRARAAEITKDAKNDDEKAQALYEYVARNIRYVSLSFGVGRYQPHSAAEVLTNKYGDCKDKATLLDALFEAAGLSSSTALINSKTEVDPDLPSPQQFDHAINVATLSGHQVWLDSTAQVAPYKYLLPGLRGKEALVVYSSAPSELLKAPLALQFPKYYRADVTGDATDTKLNVLLSFECRGDLEVLLRAGMTAMTPAQLTQVMAAGAKQAQSNSNVSFSDFKADDPFDTQKPFHIQLRIVGDQSKDAKPKSSKFPSSTFTEYELQTFLTPVLPEMPVKNELLALHGPEKFVFSAKITTGDSKTAITFVPAHLNSDFAEFNATGSFDQHTLSIEMTLDIKTSEVPANQNVAYGVFRKELIHKMSGFMTIKKPDSATSAANPNLTPASPEDEEVARQLYASGLKAFNSGNYRAAAEMFETSTARNPNNSSAFNDLGRAYLHLGRVPQAVTALRQSIAVNPFEPFAYNNLGLALMRQENYTEAATQFLKQLEVNPDDRYVHPNLGRLYFLTKDYAKSAAEFEIVAKTSPDDSAVLSQLATDYALANQPEKALKIFDHLLEISPTASTQNTVAYGLAEMNTQLDRAEALSKSSIATTAAKTATIDLANVSASDSTQMCELSAYWDTMGWIKFQGKDLAQAEKYIAAAWNLCQLPEVGDHLGQIYEKQSRKQDAIKQYELVLSKLTSLDPMPETEARLAALLPHGADVTATVAAEKDKRSAREGIKFKNSHNLDENGEAWLLFKSGPTLTALQFIAAGESLKATEPEIKALSFPDTFPDATPVTLLRRAWITCSTATHECRLGLIPANNAQSAMTLR
jgi:Flp pilus assembly protein TadD